MTVSADIKTLGAAHLERAADGGAPSIDLTGIRILVSALKNAPMLFRHLEGHLSEMSRLQIFNDIVMAAGGPSVDIFICNQDGPISSLAAGAAIETMQYGFEWLVTRELGQSSRGRPEGLPDCKGDGFFPCIREHYSLESPG